MLKVLPWVHIKGLYESTVALLGQQPEPLASENYMLDQNIKLQCPEK